MRRRAAPPPANRSGALPHSTLPPSLGVPAHPTPLHPPPTPPHLPDAGTAGTASGTSGSTLHLTAPTSPIWHNAPVVPGPAPIAAAAAAAAPAGPAAPACAAVDPTDTQLDLLVNRFPRLYVVLISLHGLVRGERMELGRDPDTGGQVRAAGRAGGRAQRVPTIGGFTRHLMHLAFTFPRKCV